MEFTNTSYEVVEGGVIPVCLKTDDELGISVVLHVFSEDQTGKRNCVVTVIVARYCLGSGHKIVYVYNSLL